MSSVGTTSKGATSKHNAERKKPPSRNATQLFNTLYKRVDKEDKGVANSDSLGGRQKNLYGLTYDEVLVVDLATPISREEYLAYKETNAKC